LKDHGDITRWIFSRISHDPALPSLAYAKFEDTKPDETVDR